MGSKEIRANKAEVLSILERARGSKRGLERIARILAKDYLSDDVRRTWVELAEYLAGTRSEAPPFGDYFHGVDELIELLPDDPAAWTPFDERIAHLVTTDTLPKGRSRFLTYWVHDAVERDAGTSAAERAKSSW